MPESAYRGKCDYCTHEAIMQVKNLKDNVVKKMCSKHFADFITDGQSRVMEQFIQAGGIPGMFGGFRL